MNERDEFIVEALARIERHLERIADALEASKAREGRRLTLAEETQGLLERRA